MEWGVRGEGERERERKRWKDGKGVGQKWLVVKLNT
jgi:hypothetical protein